MKKVMLIGLLAVSSVASVAFAVGSNQQSTVRKAGTCKKVMLLCPDGKTAYYKCVLGDTNSPDCWYTGPNSCNITEYPCQR